MKKFYFLLAGLVLSGLSYLAFANTHVDDKGVVWSYEYYDMGGYYDNYGNWHTYGGIRITGVQGNSADVIVPDSLDYNGTMMPVISIAQSSDLFYNNRSIKSVKLPNTVSYLDGNAFDGCTNLQNINIPTNLQSIQWGTFRECYSLEKIIIPEGVTSIGGDAFGQCYKLKDITLPQSLETIESYAFRYVFRSRE